jgi:alkaline phosphatase D
VSSSGYGDNITQGNTVAEGLITDNPELQWTEGYFRGYFEMHVTAAQLDARFFGVPTVAERTSLELSMANFTVIAGENRLSRPLSGGQVENGFLRGGEVVGTNLTRDTSTGEWAVREFEKMYIEYESADH